MSIPKGNEIIRYLQSIGYERQLIGESVSGDKLIINFTTTLFKGDVKITLDFMTASNFKIYRNNEKVFDINEATREVIPIKHGSDKKIKTKGISHPVSISEVKEALRILNIDSLLDE